MDLKGEELLKYFENSSIKEQELVGCWERIEVQIKTDFMLIVLQNHYEKCDVLRLDFFNNCISIEQLSVLRALSKDGKDCRYFEHQIGSLVLKWAKEAQIAIENRTEFIAFVTELMKTAFLYFKEEEITGILEIMCQFNAVSVLDVICRYGTVPNKSVGVAVEMLCRTNYLPGINNLRLSRSVLVDIALIDCLYKKEFCIGALEFISPKTDTLLLYDALLFAAGIQDLEICDRILEYQKQILDKDFKVKLLIAAKWAYKSPLKSKLDELFSIAELEFSSLSFYSKTELLNAALEFIDDEHKMIKAVTHFQSCYWINPIDFVSFLDSFVLNVFLVNTNWHQLRVEFLGRFFNVFLQEPVCSVAKNELLMVVKNIFTIIGVESEASVLHLLFESFSTIYSMLPSSLFDLLYEKLFTAIANIKGEGLEEFWTCINSGKIIRNIEDIRETGKDFINAELDLITRNLYLDFAFKLFDLSVIRKRPVSNLYRWMCWLSSWILVVDDSIRAELLKYLSKFKWESFEISYISNGEKYYIHEPLPVDNYIYGLVAILRFETSTDVLVLALDNLELLLQNKSMVAQFKNSLRILAETLCKIILNESAGSNLVNISPNFRKHELYRSMFTSLVELFQYQDTFSKSAHDTFINVLLFGIGKWPPVAKHCLRGLSIALFELPLNSIRVLGSILLKISQVTSSNLAQSNLEFLASLASLPNLHVNLAFDDYKRIFGIALTYLRTAKGSIVTLAYYVTQIWFLSLKLAERQKYVPIIVTLLLANTATVERTLDESVELVLDMMVQHTLIDCHTRPRGIMQPEQIKSKRSWCLGNSIVTVLVGHNMRQQLVIRRASGVTVFNVSLENAIGKAVIQEQNRIVMSAINEGEIFVYKDRASDRTRTRSASLDSSMPEYRQENARKFSHDNLIAPIEFKPSAIDVIDPAFLFLQVQPYPDWGGQASIPIPENEMTMRALSVLDRTPSVDLHKIGVLYVAPGQLTESEILGNTHGSSSYELFLRDLGDLYPLNSNTNIYTGGLDSSEQKLDGSFAISYIPDQRLTQVIFHVTTMMPNNPHDEQHTGKKRHIGNDFVNIIWNESGKEFDFNTIPGQFNLFQIVIEPLDVLEFETGCFKISTNSNPSTNFIGITTDIVSGRRLGVFVRQICIYCNLLAQVASGVTASTAIERLRQIKRLKERLPKISHENDLDFSHLII